MPSIDEEGFSDVSMMRSLRRTTKNRFICYLDVMGFKDFIYRNPHQKAIERTASIAMSSRQIGQISLRHKPFFNFQTSHLRSITFSDSTLIWTDDDSEKSLKSIIGYSSILIGALINAAIPVKGALSHGEFTAHKTHQVFVGKPLVDAFELTEQVHFYGLVFHHTMRQWIDQFIQEDDPFSDMLYTSRVPLKEGSSTHSFIRPTMNSEFLTGGGFHIVSAERITGTEALKNKCARFYETSSGKHAKYVDNTIDVYAVSGDSPIFSPIQPDI